MFRTENRQIIRLELVGDSGTLALETTPSHPFWLVGQGWVEAAELQPGDEVFSATGAALRVSASTWLQAGATAYNMEVEDFHTYFVGEDGVWVHNAGDDPNCPDVVPGGGGAPKAAWPWKRKTASVRELTAGGGNCKACAVKIQKSMGGDIIHIVDSYGAPGIGKVFNKRGELISSRFTEHFAVRKGDMVFDRITGPDGMHISDYKKLFEYGDDGLVFDRVVKLAD